MLFYEYFDGNLAKIMKWNKIIIAKTAINKSLAKKSIFATLLVGKHLIEIQIEFFFIQLKIQLKIQSQEFAKESKGYASSYEFCFRFFFFVLNEALI